MLSLQSTERCGWIFVSIVENISQPAKKEKQNSKTTKKVNQNIGWEKRFFCVLIEGSEWNTNPQNEQRNFPSPGPGARKNRFSEPQRMQKLRQIDLKFKIAEKEFLV